MRPTADGPAARSVILAGALDTKGEEYGYLQQRLSAAGVPSILVDTGVLGTPRIGAEIDRRAVAAAGAADLDALVARQDRNDAMVAMARGAAALVRGLYDEGRVSGVMMLGGSNAGFVMSRIAAALPIGVPKVLVSTIVAGDTRPYVGTSDLTMIYPVVDIAGLNSISVGILARAADACAGMVLGPPPSAEFGSAPSIACSMFGVTTPCVDAVRHSLTAQGNEVQVFHANGTGGRGMEAMVRSGFFTAVADVTTTELADELLGGVCSAGPHRLEAAGDIGVPQVVSVGALDMVNFGARDTVPDRYADRLLHAHNPAVTLMRTNPAECADLGALLAEKVNRATGPVEVHVPTRGFSQMSVEGAPFHDPDADAALIDALRSTLHRGVPLHLHDLAINDARFAIELVNALQRTVSITKGNAA